MTEKQFQDAVVQYAHIFRWRVQHTRPARRKDGQWRTPIQGDAGFPDLVLVQSDGSDGPLFVELKSATGKISRSQTLWLEALRKAGAEVYLWRPADWEAIAARLQRR